MRRESPTRRRNPSGKVVWLARYTGRDGKRHIAKPTWNRGRGTFDRKADAQRAIDEAYGLSDRPVTLGAYFETWTERHPRSASDPRAQKRRRSIRVFSFEEMHRFARAAGRYEALVRTFTDTGMRLGEVLPLRAEDFDGETLQVRRTAHEGTILAGTKTDHGEEDAGRVVPVPATLAWMLEAQINVNGSDRKLIFTTPGGRMWRERNFYRDVWKPTQATAGLDIRPHECRHSFVTHLRAAGVNDADLAEIAGHRVQTMLARYTHPVGESFSLVRGAVG